MNTNKNRLVLMVLVATVCVTLSGGIALRAQESDAPKAKQKATEKRKAKPTKPADSPEGTSTTPVKSAAGKPGSKDTARPSKTPVGKETVWVNTATGIYHKKGARYYGKTKEGKYMPEDEAVQAGYKRSKRN